MKIDVALEHPNLAGISTLPSGISKTILSLGAESSMPIMIGVFIGSGRMNLGEYRHPVTAHEARDHLFEIVKQRLNLECDPVRIGTIDAVYGHPITGWPARELKDQ